MEKEKYIRDLFEEFFSQDNSVVPENKEEVANNIYEANRNELLNKKMAEQEKRKLEIIQALEYPLFTLDNYKILLGDLMVLSQDLKFVNAYFEDIYKQKHGLNKHIVKFVNFIVLPHLMVQFLAPINVWLHLVISSVILFVMCQDAYVDMKAKSVKKDAKNGLEKHIEEKKNEILSKVNIYTIYHSLKFYSKKQRNDWIREYILNEKERAVYESSLNNLVQTDLRLTQASDEKEKMPGINSYIKIIQNRLDNEILKDSPNMEEDIMERIGKDNEEKSDGESKKEKKLSLFS